MSRAEVIEELESIRGQVERECAVLYRSNAAYHQAVFTILRIMEDRVLALRKEEHMLTEAHVQALREAEPPAAEPRCVPCAACGKPLELVAAQGDCPAHLAGEEAEYCPDCNKPFCGDCADSHACSEPEGICPSCGAPRSGDGPCGRPCV